MKKTIFILSAVVLLFACKKKKDDVFSPVGFWAGNYGNGTTTPATPYAFLFRGDGTVRVYANKTDTATATKAEGVYTFSNTVISVINYKYTTNDTYSMTGNLSADQHSLSGTWGSGTNTTGGGNFSIIRQ